MRYSIVYLFLLIFPVCGYAQFPEDWFKPYPAFRIIDNLYGVGTQDLSVFLMTSDEGHILINTGMEGSTGIIRNNIESLGYKLEDVKILLCMQAHLDHAASFAEIKALTDAAMWATAGDAPFLEDGGFSDPHFGGEEHFKPVKVNKFIQDGEVIELGDISLTVHEHPGHTQGSTSFSFKTTENGKDYRVVIANMGTINTGKRLIVNPTYPGVAEDFANTYRDQKAMAIDIWVAAHAGQYGMHDKYKPGDAYDPDTFVDPEGFLHAVSELEKKYLEQVAKETQQ